MKRSIIMNQKGDFAELKILPSDQSGYYGEVYRKFDKDAKTSCHSQIITLYDNEVENGVPYTYDLCCSGMMATFYQFPGTTNAMVAQAKRDLKSNHDVVSVRVKKLKTKVAFEMPERRGS